MSSLYADSIIKSYGHNQVLTDVYMTCNKGEIIGLLGRNGAGKSTLLKIIFGSLRADTKFVRVGNKIIDGLFDNRLLVKYLPQDNFLPNHITIQAITRLFCNAKNAALISENPLIKPLLKKKSKQLSGGEKRILEIMLIAYSDAQFILIDEPFNGIAPVYKDEIKQLIREQSASKGFIITDHDYRNILDIATRAFVLYDGKTIEINDKEDLRYWGYLPGEDQNQPATQTYL